MTCVSPAWGGPVFVEFIAQKCVTLLPWPRNLVFNASLLRTLEDARDFMTMMVTKTSENRQQLADAQMQNYRVQHEFCSGNHCFPELIRSHYSLVFLSQYWLQYPRSYSHEHVYSSVCIQQGHLWGRLFANCPHTDCPG